MKDIGELKSYLKNNEPISIDLFFKYKNKINKVRGLKVKFICNQCNENEICAYNTLQNRNDIICHSCYRSYRTKIRKIQKCPDELEHYILNNNPIPYKLYLKYYKKYNGINGGTNKVLINCNMCNGTSKIRWLSLQKRNNQNEMCSKCLSLIGQQQRHNIPEELQFKGSKKNPIKWGIYIKYKNSYSKQSKKWIKIVCQECNENKLIQWRKVANRKYSKDLPICSDCINLYKSNLTKVKKINSKAQKIAQNKPKTLEKNRKSQLKRYKNNPELKKYLSDKLNNFYQSKEGKKIRKFLSKNSQELWKNKEYREKCSSYGNYLSGYYNDILFNSSYELSFLVYYEGYVERSNIIIPYKLNGKTKNYYPDFILNQDNKKILVEIKGFETKEVIIKNNAAEKFIKNINEIDDYQIYYYDDLKKLPNFKFFNKKEKLFKLDQNKLEIINYPKNWN